MHKHLTRLQTDQHINSAALAYTHRVTLPYFSVTLAHTPATPATPAKRAFTLASPRRTRGVVFSAVQIRRGSLKRLQPGIDRAYHP